MRSDFESLVPLRIGFRLDSEMFDLGCDEPSVLRLRRVRKKPACCVQNR